MWPSFVLSFITMWNHVFCGRGDEHICLFWSSISWVPPTPPLLFLPEYSIVLKQYIIWLNTGPNQYKYISEFGLHYGLHQPYSEQLSVLSEGTLVRFVCSQNGLQAVRSFGLLHWPNILACVDGPEAIFISERCSLLHLTAFQNFNYVDLVFRLEIWNNLVEFKKLKPDVEFQ